MSNNLSAMDGGFEYEGKTIHYRVTDKFDEKPRLIQGVEKISRYLHYYNDKLELLGFCVVYGTYDEMQNIHPIYAERVYKKEIENN